MRAILLENVTKKFGDFTAVDGLSFHVDEGEIFGLLGPNGAGKTTTIKMITGLLRPTSGRIEVLGMDVTKETMRVKERLGWVSSEVILDDDLTAMQNLWIQAKLYGVKNWRERAENLLRFFGLEGFKDSKVKGFSTGMRKKLEIAMALLHSPEIILMDEPTVGLDVVSRKAVWEVITRVNKELKVTILLTTHYLEEADSLCNRIVIINRGKKVVEGTPEELKSRYAYDVIELESAVPLKLDGWDVIYSDGNKYRIKVKDAASVLPSLIMEVGAQNLRKVSVKRASLDSVFISLTGLSIEEAGGIDERKLQMILRRARR
ncbi:MAG: ATP-binding cassette domain-containing protein [Sulfolobales archaeon]|jgi:ABC-2 type transport system ATP-binding protein|nr:ATP-binding cassette domain-containing protein [Sulfolobales archaeon]MDT7899992.1 ATP-binding cassette domain-containing protein [Sulfolobales archaeon]MDT7905950.1 ATP-binding cassette domain-containing protein [Sulfolobales archaeon]